MNILNIGTNNEEIDYLRKGELFLNENSCKTLNYILNEPQKFYESVNFRMNEKRFEWRLSFQHEENKLRESGKPAEFAVILQDTLRKKLDYSKFFTERQLRHMGIELLTVFTEKENHNARAKLMDSIGLLLLEERTLNPVLFEEKMKEAGIKITANKISAPTLNETEEIKNIYNTTLKNLQKEKGHPLLKQISEKDYNNKYFKAFIMKSFLKEDEFSDFVVFDLMQAAQIHYVENTPLPNKNNISPTQKIKMKP